MTPETLLLRQVNPSWMQEGRPSSQTFMPTGKDEGLLSTYDGDLIDPERAWEHFTVCLGRSSCGVLGVEVGECSSIELNVRSDPDEFQEHVVIDFNGFGTKEIRRKASWLKGQALSRGWMHEAII